MKGEEIEGGKEGGEMWGREDNRLAIGPSILWDPNQRAFKTGTSNQTFSWALTHYSSVTSVIKYLSTKESVIKY